MMKIIDLSTNTTNILNIYFQFLKIIKHLLLK
jgi:hypothetical protein